jgi:hypothetical protein
MFGSNHYVPILKGRDGEYGALKQLSPSSKNRTTPVIELPPISWDFAQNVPGRTIDDHLKKVARKIENAWGSDSNLFLDFLWIGENERMEDGRHPVDFTLDATRTRGLKLIPVVGLTRNEAYLQACASAVRQDRRGACIRIQREDFVDFSDLPLEFRRILKILGTNQADTDVILDLRALTPETRQIDAKKTLALISQVPDLNRWRTFTLAATSFPESLIGLPPSDVSFIPREEWKLWREVVQKRPKRIPIFGDYGISHPEPSEVDPRIMRPSASIRYTAESYWIVPKARNLRDYGYEQFHDVCRTLMKRPEFSGRRFSWGDEYIDECANEQVGTGNLTTWRKVGTSHHLKFSLRQLSTPIVS